MTLRKDKPDAYAIRDPVHGFISLSQREMGVVNTPIFQRLRRIRQLAMANLVYPGATHTRFEHSLGVLHIAANMVLRANRAPSIKKKDVVPLRLAALLHDLGHGPFSHISEYLLAKYFDAGAIANGTDIEEIHEDITCQLISSDKDLQKVLGRVLQAEIVSILGGQEGGDVRKDFVSGPLDADKLDYLLRDAYSAGVKYGTFDLPKILESMTLMPARTHPRLGINHEGVHAIEQMVMAKHHMTVQVYRHRVRAITDAMIIRGIELAIRNRDREMTRLYKYDGTWDYLDFFKGWWDDRVVEHMLRSRARNAREVFERLFNRRLLKLVHERGINDREMPDVDERQKFLHLGEEAARKMETNIAGIMKCSPDHVIVNIVNIKNPTYRTPTERISEDEIHVLQRDGKVKCLKEIHWSVMNLAHVEEKQQYVEVYGPFDDGKRIFSANRSKDRIRLDSRVQDVLYS